MDSGRSGHPLQLEVAEVAELEEALDQASGLLRQVHALRARELLDAFRHTDGAPHRRVVHPQVVSDLADDHLTAVQAEARGKVQTPGALDFLRVAA